MVAIQKIENYGFTVGQKAYFRELDASNLRTNDNNQTDAHCDLKLTAGSGKHIINQSDTQLDALIESVSNAKIGDYVTIKEYNILNKIAQKDDIGDWLLPVSK